MNDKSEIHQSRLDDLMEAERLLSNPLELDYACSEAEYVLNRIRDDVDLCGQAERLLSAFRGLYRIAQEARREP